MNDVGARVVNGLDYEDIRSTEKQSLASRYNSSMLRNPAYYLSPTNIVVILTGNPPTGAG